MRRSAPTSSWDFPARPIAQASDARRRIWTRLPLTHVHVFPYSHRPGTEASGDAGACRQPPSCAHARAAVRAASDRLSRAFRASQVGTVRRALVVDDGTAAVTDNYLRLRLDRPRVRNEWIEVEVLDANCRYGLRDG